MKKIYLLIILTLVPLLTMCSGPYGRMMDGWDRAGGYGYGGMFMWIILLILIGLLVYFFMQTQKTKGQTPTQVESHLDILKKRYAKGEINKEDFDRMKRDLET
jgi:putative membrane protein